MKRKYNLLLIATPILLTALIILPISFAQRRSGPSGPERIGGEPSGKSKKEKGGKKIMPVKPETQFAPRARALQESGPTPVVSQAVAFAVSPAIRDLPPEDKEPTPLDRVRDIQKNPRKIFRFETDNPNAISNDSAIQSSAPVPNIPAPLNSFEGQSIEDTIALGQGFLPPDTVGDVGPNHYVQAVNSTYRVFNKNGTPATPVRTLGSLFATIPGPCANTNDGDPTVNYDSLADRWVISQFCTVANPNNHQLFAVSQTGDPTGAYYLYDFMMPNNKFNDYPKIGVWPNGYYMTDNQFNQTGTAFLGGGAFAFDRAKMLAGDPTASFIYFDLETLDPSIGGMLPSDADGLVPPAAGAPNVFSYFIATEFGDASDGLRLFNFNANFAVPASSTFTERAESPLAVAAFNPLSPAGADDIEQPPPANNATAALDSIQDRLMNRLQYRNFGTHESLIVNHTVNVGTGNTQALHQAGVRYYELRRSGGAYSVNEQASFAPDTNNRWMGSAAMDNQGSLAVGYSVSSTTTFPSIRYAGRLATDPAGGLFQGEATLVAGGFVQVNTSSRWGDYSQLNVDPVDDCTFWYTQEYYSTDNPAINAEWKTRFGSFRVNAACTAPAQGTLQVNVTNCDTGLPIRGATVSINGNLYDATEASGQSLTQLPPGTYSVVIGGAGYNSVTTTGVVVNNGATTVLNVCITGIANIVPSGSTITAESCSPADNALSPGETVTVNFGLRNNGTAPTTNLVATLQATGGVSSPSGPQNYGVIPPDNATVVTRPFTFTVDPAKLCGDTVTATFNLQDGALNLGTVTFTLQVGAPGGSITASYSSGNIAVPIPDVSTVDVPITVSDTGQVQDVNVRVRLNHTFDGDLVIQLVHPDGTIVNLANKRGGAGQNYGTGNNDCSGTPTGFDDAAAATIASGVAPFAGSFKPETVLSALNGKPANGTWKLRVSDTAALDVGTIGCATIEITRAPFVCCGVGGTPNITAGPAILVNESCPPPNGAIDPGERVTVNLSLTNGGTGATTNLVATLQSTGGVNSPSGPQSYGVLTPTGPGSTGTRDFSFTAVGICGGTITATWNLQDGATNLGTVTKTFTLGGIANATTAFSNPGSILIPAGAPGTTSGPAAPYPSTINVAGVVGTVSKVTVTLKNMNHTFPDDIDVLLVGPGGQKILVMSDAGGSADLVNNTYTFDDTAAGALADGALNANGTYKPSNYGTGDTFPAPAPVGPYTDPQLLSVFNGVNPNGTWSLYVVDDLGGDIGNINLGWELNITTSTPVCTTPCGIVRLVVTSTLTRVNSTTVKATYRVQNTGTVTATSVQLTNAKLGVTVGSPLPQALGNIAPGAFSAFSDVFFTNSSPGSNTILQLSGNYTGGTFSSTKPVTVP